MGCLAGGFRAGGGAGALASGGGGGGLVACAVAFLPSGGAGGLAAFRAAFRVLWTGGFREGGGGLPEDSPPPSPSSMGARGAAGAAVRGFSRVLAVMPTLVARGSVRESKVRRLYPREMSEEWLKIIAILLEICVSVHVGFSRFHSRYFRTNWECRISRIPGGMCFSSPLSTCLYRNPNFPNV